MDSPSSGVLGFAMTKPASISDDPASRNEQRALCWSRAGFGAAAGEKLLYEKEACRGDGDWLGVYYGSEEEGEKGSGP